MTIEIIFFYVTVIIWATFTIALAIECYTVSYDTLGHITSSYIFYIGVAVSFASWYILTNDPDIKIASIVVSILSLLMVITVAIIQYVLTREERKKEFIRKIL